MDPMAIRVTAGLRGEKALPARGKRGFREDRRQAEDCPEERVD